METTQKGQVKKLRLNTLISRLAKYTRIEHILLRAKTTTFCLLWVFTKRRSTPETKVFFKLSVHFHIVWFQHNNNGKDIRGKLWIHGYDKTQTYIWSFSVQIGLHFEGISLTAVLVFTKQKKTNPGFLFFSLFFSSVLNYFKINLLIFF